MSKGRRRLGLCEIKIGTPCACNGSISHWTSNALEPLTLVRSPTFTNSECSSITSVPHQFLVSFAGMPLAWHQSELEQIAGASHKARILPGEWPMAWL